MNLTEEQIDFTIRCMSEWVRVKEFIGQGTPSSADVDHSALLRRLLSGQPALEHAPPRSFSCPNYDLATGKEIGVYEFRELPSNKVCIDQDLRWEWVDREHNILKFTPSGELYDVRRDGGSVLIKKRLQE